MKTEFTLDSHLADLTGSKIQIVGQADEHKPYVRIQLPNLEHVTSTNTCLFIEDKDLEIFAVNILKAIKSKKLNNIEKLLEEISELEYLAQTRGAEYIAAMGDDTRYYKTPDFTFSNDRVDMRFQEDTRHDCPDYKSVTLTIAELELTNEVWSQNMERVRLETKAKQDKIKQDNEARQLTEKRKQLEKLKAELEP